MSKTKEKKPAAKAPSKKSPPTPAKSERPAVSTQSKAPAKSGVTAKQTVPATAPKVSVGEQPLERGGGLQDTPVLVVGAEAHHPLHARPVVPAPIHQDEFAG